MPSTYTVNLGIEKPATGEQSGTWGDTTNVNFDILDQAVNGAARVTLTSAGSSGSPNTLAITNGATSDGRNKWVEFYSSGDLGGDVFVQLDPNDAEKIVFVRNSLASSRSILLFQGTYNSGRDLEIPAGVDMVVKFDGGGASAATVTDVYTKLRATEITTPTLTGGTVVASTSLNIAGDGATVTGIKDEDNMASNSATKLATQQSIKAYVDSQVGTVDTLAEILANGNTTGGTDIAVSTGDDITFADSSKAIFGAGSDLQIYHDGSNSYISDGGTGSLRLQGVDLQAESTNGDVYFTCVSDGAFSARHDGSTKLATTSTGIDVTGTLDVNGGANSTQAIFSGTADRGLVISTESVGAADEGVILNATASGTTGKITFQTNDATSLELAGNGGTGTFHQGLIVNEDSAASGDFRVESDSNTHALFVDASTNRVLFGKSSPDAANTNHVTIGGSLDTSWGASLGFENDATGGSNGFVLATDDSWGIGTGFGMGLGATGSDNIRLFFKSTESVFNERSQNIDFRVESDNYSNAFLIKGDDGNIGVNTSNPVSPFVVSNGGASGMEFHPELATNFNRITNFNRSSSAYNELGIDALAIELRPSGVRKCSINASDMVVNQDSADYDFRVETDSNANMLFVDGGNNAVCINTNSITTAPLNIQSDSSARAIRIVGRSDDYAEIDFFENDNSTQLVRHQAHNTYYQIRTYAIPLKLATNETNRFIIDVDGRKIMNGASSWSGITGGSQSGSAFNVAGDFYSSRATSSNSIHVRWYNTNGNVGNIATNGSGTVYSTTSDIRLKDNIESIAGGTEKLMAMKPVTHTWIADPEADAVHGFIAQEMMEIVPEAVSGDPDSDEMMSMDYGRITPVLVAALQDAHNKITALEKRLAEMEIK